MTIPSPDDKHTQEAATRYLTKAECRAFGPPGSQNEVTPVVEDGKVTAVIVYTTHVTGTREGRTRPYGHPTYRRLVEAADAAIQKPPADAAAPEIEALEILIAEREWDIDAAGYRRWIAAVDAGVNHDGDCTKQCHSCIVCSVERIREAARAYFTAASAAMAQKVEKAQQTRDDWRKLYSEVCGELNAIINALGTNAGDGPVVNDVIALQQSLASARAEVETLKGMLAKADAVISMGELDQTTSATEFIEWRREAIIRNAALAGAKDKP